MVKSLLDGGASANAINSIGQSVLYGAAFYGHAEIARWLLEHNAATDVADIDGDTPLCVASQNGHVDVIALLLDRNASVNDVNSKGNCAIGCITQWTQRRCPVAT